MIMDNDLLSIQEARILAEQAFAAQKQLAAFSQAHLDRIVEAMVEVFSGQARSFAELSFEETGYGNPGDKEIKNRFVCREVFSALKKQSYVGVIRENLEKSITDIGVPVGVIAALCPSTSPVSTTLYKAMIAIKSGNAIIFSPHPRARNTIGRLLDQLIRTAEDQGLPAGCLSYLSTVTVPGTCELMNHPQVSLVMNTGVGRMKSFCQASGKPMIYGGYGNGPAFIERTADVDRAVCDIIASKTFDYGIVPSAEQAVVVDACIQEKVRNAFEARGAMFLTRKEVIAFEKFAFCPKGGLNPGMVGIPAPILAARAGLKVPDDTRLLMIPRDYVSESDPFSRELLCPVLSYYVENDWMDACEKCIELLVTQRNGHTMAIHSADSAVIHEFALKKPVGRLLVNTPATFGGLGMTTRLFPAMTLGSGSAGQGITSDNVSPRNLIYVRKVGYGSRTCVSRGIVPLETKTSSPENFSGAGTDINAESIRQIVEQVVKSLNPNA